MRILQIVPSISLVYGGPSQMVLGLSKALAEASIQVTILTTNSNGDRGQPPLEVPLGKSITQDGYNIIYFSCFPWRRYKFSPSLLYWLFKNADDYDVAHIHALFSPVTTAAAMIARFKNLPYILRPLGTLDPADLEKKKYQKRIYAWLLEKHNLSHATAIHFTSEKECEISERFGSQTQDLIIPLGVNIPETLPIRGIGRQQLGIAPDSNMILFISRLDPKKGLELLISALEYLKEKGEDFQWVLAGSNPQNPDYEAGIKQKISQSSLADCTHVTGFVEGEFKYALLQDADLFVLPSYYENFGIAVAEAMTVGTAVLISEQVYISAGIKAVDAGWVVPLQVEALAKELETALHNPELRAEKAKKGQQLARQTYSWNAIAQQMISIYLEICLETDFPTEDLRI